MTIVENHDIDQIEEVQKGVRDETDKFNNINEKVHKGLPVTILKSDDIDQIEEVQKGVPEEIYKIQIFTPEPDSSWVQNL